MADDKNKKKTTSKRTAKKTNVRKTTKKKPVKKKVAKKKTSTKASKNTSKKNAKKTTPKKTINKSNDKEVKIEHINPVVETKPYIPKLKSIRALEKKLQKTELRLAKKNRQMMALNAQKKAKEMELEELKTRIKDLEFLLEHKENELKGVEVASNASNNTHEVQRMEEDRNSLVAKIDELKAELRKKDAVIELFRKPEYDYSGIVKLDLERIKTKWIGWAEGANLEEIDFNMVNHSEESLEDVVIDIYLEDVDGNSYKYDGFLIKKQVNPKERVARKLHLFKQLKKKGNYKVEVRVFVKGHSKEIAEQTKILTV